MKNSVLLLLTIILYFFSCQSKNDKSLKESDLPKEKTAQFFFSDNTKKDIFRIAVLGDKIEDMHLVFSIQKADKGTEIYKTEIKATEFIDNFEAAKSLKNETAKINFLKEEIDVFFDEQHFLEPALTSEETPDSNVPDLDFFKELKNSKLNGFEYRIGKDKKYYIAWSNKEQKVKIYYQCC